MTAYDAMVLAGGRASRLAGVDKPAMPVGGTAMLDRVLAAVAGARLRIVVGPPPAATAARPVDADVVTREDPPGGGPVAAIVAGLPHVRCAALAVLAADLPFLTPAAVDKLLAALPSADVAVLVDDEGRDQLLASVWRTNVLQDRLNDGMMAAGRSVRSLFARLDVARVHVIPAAGEPPPWLDCDTPEDLRRAEEWT